jgi:hypothetical protein
MLDCPFDDLFYVCPPFQIVIRLFQRLLISEIYDAEIENTVARFSSPALDLSLGLSFEFP